MSQTLEQIPSVSKKAPSGKETRKQKSVKSPAKDPKRRSISHRYGVPSDFSIWIYLPLSLAFFGFTPFVIARLLPPQEEEVKQMTIEFSDVEGVENEPPPLGLPDAPAEAVAPAIPEEPVAPPEPEPEPEPEVPPTLPEPAPVPGPEPVEQALPEPPKPTPPPIKEKPQSKPKAEAKPKPLSAPKPKTGPASVPTADAPPRGVSNGSDGGRGGSRGDFIAAPPLQYDRISLARRYTGRGEVTITYSDGKITNVAMSRSTGVSYLDSYTTTTVKRSYKVKKGVSGKAKFNINYSLPS